MRPEPTLTATQSRVLTLLANNRTPQSHVAGAVLTPPVFARLSDDLNLFHDVREHVLSCFEKDRETLESFGWDVKLIIGPRDGFVRAAVIDRKSRESVLIDWAYDSAVRFFPTQPDPVFGWRLHPVDAAVNKVIAAALRSDPKDVIDVLAWHGRPLSLGALAWAVPAKDPGLGPELVLDFIERARTPSLEQIKAMRFASERESEPPSPSDIRLALRQILGEARSLLDRLPPETVGCVFLSSDGQVVEPDPSKPETLIHPHAASPGGCVPRLADGPDMPPEPPGFIETSQGNPRLQSREELRLREAHVELKACAETIHRYIERSEHVTKRRWAMLRTASIRTPAHPPPITPTVRSSPNFHK